MSFLLKKSVLSKNKKEILIIICLILLAIFFKIYNLELRMPFGWDQARDADMAWKILMDRNLTLIGPQVVSDGAFFLGPFWYYFLAPFFLITGLDPIALGLAVSLTAALTVLTYYLFLRHISGRVAAVIGAIILASNPDTLAWNPMLVPIFSIGVFYCLLKFTKGSRIFLTPALFLFGLSLQIHIQMTFFIIPITLAFIYFLKKHSFPLKEFLISLAVFLITFAPLVAFDLRHDFLNLNGIAKIFTASGDASVSLNYQDQLLTTVPKTLFSNFFLPDLGISETIIGPILVVLSIFGLLKLPTSRIFKSILLITLLLPVFVFSLYKGRLSEYYFYICLIPLLTGFSNTLQIIFKTSLLGRVVVALILVFITILSFKTLIAQRHGNGLYYQKEVVKYLVNQKEDPKINVSFDVPYGDDAGLKYLFKYYDLKISDSPENHLWTIAIPPGNSAGLKGTFGNFGLIRK